MNNRKSSINIFNLASKIPPFLNKLFEIVSV